MQIFFSIIKISRPINFIITFFAVIISAEIAVGESGLSINVLLGALALAFSCSAGNIINDIFDVEIDKINKPNRILPQGLLSITYAKYLYVIFNLIALLLASLISFVSSVFVFVLFAVIFLYSFHLKKIILIGNITVALLTASALIYGAFISANITAGIIPAFFAFSLNLLREILKDMEDIKGDVENKITTLPKLLGDSKTIEVVSYMIIFIIVLTTLPYFFEIYKIEYFVIIMGLVNPIFVYTLKILRSKTINNNIKKASYLIKLNMILGLIAIYLGV